jgi:hypothetical protein
MYCCRRVGVSICTFVPVKQVNLGFTWITNNVSIPVYPPVMPGPDAEHPLACVGPGSIVSLKGLPPISTPSYKEETKYMPACAGLHYFSTVCTANLTEWYCSARKCAAPAAPARAVR